jgi:signal transduction histidine kinase
MFSTLFPERLPSSWRLGLLLTLLMAASTAFCIAVAAWAVRQDLQSIARAVVLDDLGEYSVMYRRHGLPELAAAFAGGEHGANQAVRVTAPDGRVLFENLPPEMAGYRWPDDPGLVENERAPVLVTIERDAPGGQLLVGRQPLDDGNVLWFGRTDAEDRAYVRHVRGRLWLAGLASMALLLLPLWWFVRHVMRPVRAMMASLDRLGEGTAESRLTATGAVPELEAFASAFNTGLDRIDALTGELQDANDTLAHELRTPLARIRGNLEMYHDGTDNPSAREAAARGMEEIDRAADLIQIILTTRAGEHQALKLLLEPVELSELLGALHELYRAAADDRGLVFGLEVEPGTHAQLDRQRVSQAVANLLDNAFAYVPRGGCVTLVGTRRDDGVRILVRDNGPGLKDDERESIWRRYTRGSAASAQTPGLGLGLALVRAIAHAHGGEAGARSLPTGGAEFWIELPAAPPASGALKRGD